MVLLRALLAGSEVLEAVRLGHCSQERAGTNAGTIDGETDQ